MIENTRSLKEAEEADGLKKIGILWSIGFPFDYRRVGVLNLSGQAR
jgi:hypothetical protein